jgi:antirestriction protein
MATVTYNELSNYNAGRLVFKTFEIDGLTYDEHMEELTAWLEELTEETGELCEECNVADTEDIPSEYVRDYGISPEYFDLQERIENSCLDAEVWIAGVACGIELENIEEAYCGEFSNDVDFAYDYVEQTDMLGESSEFVSNYFDYERFARDLMMDHSNDSGHYFRNF